ncbi:MAG: type II toxin-antitoxin system prevent-host-death family antitoxin [Anaerolineae bacterium]|nr:type II toxin-antitoxin system prevent-host-death family antitoxin [Anaerolineae bacterium]
MPVDVTYTQARANLAALLDQATDDREIIIIQRRDKAAAALISADELSSLLETAYLLRSPANAQRLLTALNRALQHDEAPLSLDELKERVGLDEQEA